MDWRLIRPHPESKPQPRHAMTTISDTYTTPDRPLSTLSRMFPSLVFYARTLAIVFQAAWRTRKRYSMAEWAEDSIAFRNACEACGLRLHAENINAFTSLPGPCVIVANHMSTLETFILPGLLAPIRPVTFVLKRSLTTYPVFRHVVNAIEPIAVDRVNPRDDFRIVMDEGVERLARGISLIIFPQTTRTPSLNRAAFNTIGIKLAKKAGVPVLPLALKTDAWGVGSLIKDYGPIHPEIPVHFSLGSPIHIRGAGKNEHEEVMEFIHWKLESWRAL